MGVESIPHGENRNPMARLVCDDCQKGEVVPCRYTGSASKGTGGPDMGQAHKKATGKGWSIVKGKIHCPSCTAKRKAAAAPQKWIKDAIGKHEAEATMSKIEDKNEVSSNSIRKPTPKQERLIILALEDAYDDQAKRYRGNATDKAIADELGDGVLFGWVAEVRERLFGPSGGNEEIDAIRAAIEAAQSKVEAAKVEIDKELAALRKRLDAVCAAVGPRVRS